MTDRYRDRPAVENLYARYVHGIDMPDFAMLEECFTTDAVYEVVGRYREVGRLSIMSKIRERHLSGALHVTANIMITPEAPDRLRGQASFAVVGGTGDVDAFGEYRDLIEKIDGEWLFAHRTVQYKFNRATHDAGASGSASRDHGVES
jgi:ketosteroid isomerase-like protein